MKFATITKTFMTTGPALAASNEVIGAWVRLLVEASAQDSDVIDDYKSDREALTACGVTLSEIDAVITAGLATRLAEDGTIRVEGFDHAGLQKIKTLRENGKYGGQGGRGKGKEKEKPAN